MESKISQTLISFKINSGNLIELDQLCSEYGVKRNKMLNVLVSIGLQNLKGHKRLFDLVSVYSKVVFSD